MSSISSCVKNSTSAFVSSPYSSIVKAAVIGVAAFGNTSFPSKIKAFKSELLPALTLPKIPSFKTLPSSSFSLIDFSSSLLFDIA